MNYKTLEGQQRYFIVPTPIECGMTAVTQISQGADGAIRLLYSDGTIEERATEATPEMGDFKSVFAIVGWVQDGREQERAS